MKTAARLVLLATIGWLGIGSTAEATKPPVCAKCSLAGAAPMAEVCGTCRDVWDFGPAYWRWGYSAGAWDLRSSKNWPATPYHQPALKHLCADCKGAARK